MLTTQSQQKLEIRRFTVFFVVYVCIVSGIVFGFIIWFNKLYLKTYNDKCVVSGYDFELKTIYFYNKEQYACLPILLVDYEFAGKSFSKVKTRTFEKNDMDKAILYDNFTNIERDNIKLFYNNYIYQLKINCFSEQLIKHGYILRFLINNDIDKIKDKITDTLQNHPDISKNIYKNTIKPISAIINNSNILFKSNDDFKYLPELLTTTDGLGVVKYDGMTNILFDSGNSGHTIIGENIVKFLKLDVHGGCFIGHGFGGIQSCNGYVELSYKFVGNKYGDIEYSCIAYIDNNSKNHIIFGNKSGLYELFNDNYAIQYEYIDLKNKLYGLDDIKNIKRYKISKKINVVK